MSSSSYVDFVDILTGHVTTPVSGANLGSNVQDFREQGGFISLGQVLSGIGELGSALFRFGPGGIGFGITSAIADTADLLDRYNRTGEIDVADLNSALGSVAGAAGAIALAAGGVAVTGGAALVAGGVALSLAGAALTAAALLQSQEQNIPLSQNIGDALDAMREGLRDMQRDLGDAYANAADFTSEALRDLERFKDEFPSDFNNNRDELTRDFLDPLFDLLTSTGEWLGQNLPLPDEIASRFRDFFNWQPRRDPLSLDLDGDGLETRAESGSSGVLFDHDADGVKTATGWIGQDDGLLVRDLDGNGQIDSGRELFGDSTLLRNGQRARNGFEALADLDANADGQVNANDAAFASLRVWRDANSNGTAEAGELRTLQEAGITALNTAHETGSTNLGNGNELAERGTYVGAEGRIGIMGDLNFRESNFHSIFTAQIAPTDRTRHLPNAAGAGRVRDLREAAALSGGVATLLEQYSAAPTRAAQLVLIDELIKQWSRTSDVRGMENANSALTSFVFQQSQTTASLLGGTDQERRARLSALERFNGQDIVSSLNSGQLTRWMVRTTNNGDGSVSRAVTFSEQQLIFLDQSYNALRDYTYQALLMQTRLRPYTDLIGLSFDASNGLQLDTTALQQRFSSYFSQDAVNAAIDLLEFNKAMVGNLADSGWDGYGLLAQQLRTVPASSAMQAILNEFHVLRSAAGAENIAGTSVDEVLLGSDAANTLDGGGGDDVLDGGAGGDTLRGGAGADRLEGDIGNDNLDGGAGNDRLMGGSGDDVLNGGSGQDQLSGGEGNDTLSGSGDNTRYDGGKGNDTFNGYYNRDTYRYQLGDGQDVVTDIGGDDLIEFGEGITAATITATRQGNGIRFQFGDGGSLTVNNWFGNSNSRIEQFRFADGTQLSAAQIIPSNLILNGTVGNDLLKTLGSNDAAVETLRGLEGDDRLVGNKNDDVLEGGTGNDILVGGTGSNALLGGDGNDELYEGPYYNGGKGNDWLVGTNKDDTFVFNAGDGHDVLSEHVKTNPTFVNGVGLDYTVGNASLKGVDVLRLGAGIKPSDVQLSRVTQPIGPYTRASTSGYYGLFASVLLISLPGGDSIAVDGFFGGSTRDVAIDRIEFADGTVWDRQEMTRRGLTEQGTDGADEIRSVDGYDNNLSGLGGDDALLGGNGNDILAGGQGDDTLLGDWGNDTLHGDIGVDSLYGGAGDDILLGGTGNDLLDGNENNDNLDGEEGEDALNGGEGDDILAGGAGQDVLRGDAGNDTLSGGTDNDLIFGGIGDDRLIGDDGDDGMSGEEGDDELIGGDGIDILNGGLGNDVLDGGAGNETLRGQEGNDTYRFGLGDGQDVVMELSGSDTVLFKANVKVSDVTIHREGADIVFLLTSGDSLRIKDWYDIQGQQIELVRFADGTTWSYQHVHTMFNRIVGDSNNNTLTGNHAEGLGDVLVGFAGNDTLSSYEGDDELDGGEGNDTIYAGTGNDTIYAGEGNDAIYAGEGNNRILGGAGDDKITTATDLNEDVLAAALPSYLNIGNNIINGGDGNDQITVGQGSNLVHGDAGSDIIQSLSGDDALYGDGGDDIIKDAGGNNQIYGGLGNDVIVSGSGNDTLIGGDGDDSIIDTGGVNLMEGNAGNDRIVAFSGDDRIYGGTGIDTMAAGNGNNLVFGGDDADVVISGTGVDQIYGGTGIDTVYAGAGNDFIYGEDGADVLVGGEGDDRIEGAAGDDILMGDGGDGLTNDQIELLELNVTLGPGGSDLLLGGVGNDTLFGGGGADLLYGGVDSDRLIGGAGNDRLEGEAGDDQLNGSEGDDLLFGGSGNDVLIGGQGADTLEGSTGLDVLKGDEGDDILRGGEGNDTLSGDGGADLLYGEAGIDILNGGDGTDRLDGGDGDDVIDGGNGADILTGGAGNDVLGITAANVEQSGGMGDTYFGGAGNDLLKGSAYADTYVFNIGDGQDRIIENGASTFTDILRFGNGITANDIEVQISGLDLLLNRRGSTDSITVTGWMVENRTHIERFEFADGTVWNEGNLQAALVNSTAQSLTHAIASFNPTGAAVTPFQTVMSTEPVPLAVSSLNQ